MGKYRKMTIKMTYEVIILGHLHMPLYFIGTFTEYSYLYALGIVYKHRWAEISTGVFKISCLKICKINFILYFWSVLAFLCPSGIGNKREPGVNPGQAPLLWASLQRPDNASATVVYTSDGKASGLEQVRRPAIQAIVCAFADSEPDTCTYILLYC